MNDDIRYQKFSGAICGLQRQRIAASFVLTETDRTWGAIGAIAAAVAGNGGAAAMTASHMSDTNEEADYLEFCIDGKSFNGWVWRSPFKEGDSVDVVASLEAGCYKFIAIARPHDQVIALFPHCSRGLRCHIFNAVKWWIRFSVYFLLTVGLMDIFSVGISGFLQNIREFALVLSVVILFCAVGAAILTRKWMPFVRKAENAFQALGWPSPAWIDLKKISDVNRRWSDGPEYGIFYFRYDSSVFGVLNLSDWRRIWQD